MRVRQTKPASEQKQTAMSYIILQYSKVIKLLKCYAEFCSCESILSFRVTLFLLLSQDCRLANIWLSMAVTQSSLSSYVDASKCHICPVSDTMMNSNDSSCSERQQTSFTVRDRPQCLFNYSTSWTTIVAHQPKCSSRTRTSGTVTGKGVPQEVS